MSEGSKIAADAARARKPPQKPSLISIGFQLLKLRKVMKMSTAVVDVKPATESKINWAQVIALLVWAASFFGFVVPPEMQAAFIAAITPIQAVVTIILRTWFTKSVTPSSVK